MTGAGLLPHHAAPTVPAQVSLPLSVPISLAAVRARDQAREEALGSARQALSAAAGPAGWTVGPVRPQAVAPRQAHGAIQQVGGPVVQRGRELQVQAVEHGGSGLGLCNGERETQGHEERDTIREER